MVFVPSLVKSHISGASQPHSSGFSVIFVADVQNAMRNKYVEDGFCFKLLRFFLSSFFLLRVTEGWRGMGRCGFWSIAVCLHRVPFLS